MRRDTAQRVRGAVDAVEFPLARVGHQGPSASGWCWTRPPMGVDSRVAFMPEGPGLAALESPELTELLAELLARYALGLCAAA